MTDFKISKNKAKELAKVIFADIDSYISEHQEEYHIFLENSRTKENEDRGDANEEASLQGSAFVDSN